jgi:glutamate formiminotransferase
VLECVVNVSEGHEGPDLDAIIAAAGDAVIDVHRDEHHNRAVLTLAGPEVEAAARSVASEAVARLDLRTHAGVHPRIGVVDVVPFVPLEGATMDDARRARDEFAEWAGLALGLPCHLYGPERSLPDVRRMVGEGRAPDTGPRHHPTAGACAVGARPVLVAFNVWLEEPDLGLAKAIATSLRGARVRALGLSVGDAVQVSCNLLEPDGFGPAETYDAVAARATVRRSELVGLVPRSTLEHTPRARWDELDLGEDRTIEARVRRWRR